MKKYVIKDTIVNQKTNEKMICYMGIDGYVHSFPEYTEGYIKKGNALKRIQKEVSDTFLGRNVQVSSNQYFEANLWLHTLKIMEVEQ